MLRPAWQFAGSRDMPQGASCDWAEIPVPAMHVHAVVVETIAHFRRAQWQTLRRPVAAAAKRDINS